MDQKIVEYGNAVYGSDLGAPGWNQNRGYLCKVWPGIRDKIYLSSQNCKKGLLMAVRNGKYHMYFPKITKEEYFACDIRGCRRERRFACCKYGKGYGTH